MWPYKKMMYVPCAWVLYLVEKKQVLPWVDSVLCGVPRSLELLTFFFFFSAFPSPSLSLFLWPFRASKKGQETNVRQWETVPDVPALPTFSLSTFLAFPHPSVPLLLFSGHRRRDMQIRSGRPPNRLSRRPRLAHLFSIYFCFCIFYIFFFSFPLRQPSSRKLVFWYIFYSLCSLLFSLFLWPFRASKKGQETNVRQW